MHVDYVTIYTADGISTLVYRSSPFLGYTPPHIEKVGINLIHLSNFALGQLYYHRT